VSLENNGHMTKYDVTKEIKTVCRLYVSNVLRSVGNMSIMDIKMNLTDLVFPFS
jgi:hypothetical protein